MKCYLSKTEIVSFAGNVVCLKLISDCDIKNADIKWETDSDILRIRTFFGDDEFSFNDGVLLSLDKVGNAVVSATLDGTKYECLVTINEPKKAKSDDKLNYYIGDFHDHSSWDHRRPSFPVRTSGFPIDIINSVANEGKLDFVVLSDHGSLMKNTDLFRVFYDEDTADCKGVIVFPGSESECIATSKDDFGNVHCESGEFVMVNSQDYIFSDNFEEVNDVLKRNPHAILSIAHPFEYSTKYSAGHIGTPRILKTKNIPYWKEAVKLVEVGNGSGRGTSMLFEMCYSKMLDLGFKNCPVCPSDCHGPPHEISWGFDMWPGKTVIMAPEKSKNYFIDAINSHRVYATENGNTKLHYTVNEGRCGDTLSITDTYNFHVEIGNIDENNPKTTVKCEVISDYGKKIKIIENVDFTSFDFTVTSDSARYFFLRIIDKDGLKTWSAPIFTGREYDEEIDVNSFEFIDTTGFAVTDSLGNDASVLLSKNKDEAWHSDKTNDTIVIDMQKIHKLSALRLHEATYNLFELREQKADFPSLHAGYPAEYRVSASIDGENFEVVDEGLYRNFALGNTIYFGKINARYVKLELLSTVGKYSCRPEYENAKISLGEIVFLK